MTPSIKNCLQREVKGNQRSPKMWWAKPIATEEFYIGGRPSVQQIKYLAESGIRSIVSFDNFSTPFPAQDVPISKEERRIVEDELGLNFGIVLPDGMDWRDSKSFELFGKLYERMPKPLFYHCSQGYAASFVALGYFAMRSKEDPNFQPRITLKDVYEIGAKRGYHYHNDNLDDRVSQVINSVVGTPDFEYPKPQESLPNYMMKYWWPEMVHDRYYISGQFLADQFELIKDAGFDTIVNLRNGHDVSPRDEVTLLNVKDDTGYHRQDLNRLQLHRLNVSRSNSYVHKRSSYNFALWNELEFGDHVGYNEMTEKGQVQGRGLKYYHIPTGSDKRITRRVWENIRQRVLNATSTGHVLIHSRTGRKAALVALLVARESHGLSAEWAMQRAADIGYDFRGEDFWWARELLEDNAGDSMTAQLRTLAITLLTAVVLIS